MALIDKALYVRGQALPPYVGEWEEISRARYPDAEFDWTDAQLFTAEAKTGQDLTLDDTLAIEQMVRERVFEEGGGPLASVIFRRLERLPSGQTQWNYKVEHAAHGSPIVWAAVVAFITANWKAILITLGVLAATAALITFTIKSTSIIWRAGQKIEEAIEEAPPALIAGIGAGLLVLVALVAFGTRRGEKKRA